jgi:acetyl-CoA carboxylase carboxyl transferase subunit alpha
VKELGCVDDVLSRAGGRDPPRSRAAPWRWWTSGCASTWRQLDAKPMEQLLEERYQKFRNIAQFYTTAE